MSMFRAKKLDLGCFFKARTIRDHTKRKVFEANEVERYDQPCTVPAKAACDSSASGALRDRRDLLRFAIPSMRY